MFSNQALMCRWNRHDRLWLSLAYSVEVIKDGCEVWGNSRLLLSLGLEVAKNFTATSKTTSAKFYNARKINMVLSLFTVTTEGVGNWP